MNIECSVKKIRDAVGLADRMTGKNLTLPILHAILLTASGKSLKIRSTNLNVGIEIEIPVKINKEGSVLIKGDILANILNHLEETETVFLKLNNENILIQTNKTKTIAKCLPNEEFPNLPIVEGESFEMKASSFVEGIRSVYFCAATTEIKPEIASIFIYSDGEMIVFVATDSFRLAEKKIRIKNIPEISKILLPYRNISDILRVLDSFSNNIKISFNKNQISIYGEGVYFTSRLIDGGFPDYHLILPKEENTKIVMMKQELLNTLRLSTIFSDKFFQVLLSVVSKEKKIKIESKNNDVGSSEATIDAVIEGEDIEITFNLKYFLDVFQAINGDSISISFTKQNKPILVKSVQDPSFLYLLVPTNR